MATPLIAADIAKPEPFEAWYATNKERFKKPDGTYDSGAAYAAYGKEAANKQKASTGAAKTAEFSQSLTPAGMDKTLEDAAAAAPPRPVDKRAEALARLKESQIPSGVPGSQEDAANAATMQKYQQYLKDNNVKDSDVELANWLEIQKSQEAQKRTDDSIAFGKATQGGGISGGLTPLSAVPATGGPRIDGDGKRPVESQYHEAEKITGGEAAPAHVVGPVVSKAIADQIPNAMDKKGGVDWDKVGQIAKDTGLGILGVLQAAIAGWSAGQQGRGLDFQNETLTGQLDVKKQADEATKQARQEKVADWQNQLAYLQKQQEFQAGQAQLDREAQQRQKAIDQIANEADRKMAQAQFDKEMAYKYAALKQSETNTGLQLQAMKPGAGGLSYVTPGK